MGRDLGGWGKPWTLRVEVGARGPFLGSYLRHKLGRGELMCGRGLKSGRSGEGEEGRDAAQGGWGTGLELGQKGIGNARVDCGWKG